MKLTYHRCGDYLLPALTIPDESVTLGKYGRMRKTYLKEHKSILYNALLLSGKLTEHLIGVDAECRERLEILLPQMMQVEGVDEALKARDQMEWVRRMNSIQNRAEEILLNELVYDKQIISLLTEECSVHSLFDSISRMFSVRRDQRVGHKYAGSGGWAQRKAWYRE